MKWATFSSWLQWNQSTITPTYNYSLPVSFRKSVFYSPITINFFSIFTYTSLPCNWNLIFNILLQTGWLDFCFFLIIEQNFRFEKAKVHAVEVKEALKYHEALWSLPDCPSLNPEVIWNMILVALFLSSVERPRIISKSESETLLLHIEQWQFCLFDGV